jgi:hypothetical protein
MTWHYALFLIPLGIILILWAIEHSREDRL